VRIWDPVTGRQLGDPLTGHVGRALGISIVPSWTPDGTPDGRILLATTGEDATVRIWDPVTGRQLGDPLTGHTGGVWAVCAFLGRDADSPSSNGSIQLASCGEDGTIRIWNPATGRQLGEPLVGHIGAVLGICALDDQQDISPATGYTLLATAGEDGTIRTWNPKTGRAVGQPFSVSSRAIDLLTPGPSVINDCIAGAINGAIYTWEPARASLTQIKKVSRASTLATTKTKQPEHPRLVVGDDNGVLRQINVANSWKVGSPLQIEDGAVLVLCPLPGPHQRVAAAGRSGTIRVVSLDVRKYFGPEWRAHGTAIRCLRLIEGDPPLLATAGHDGSIRLWSLGTWKPFGEPLIGHEGYVWSLTQLPGTETTSPRLVSAGADHTIRLWDPYSRRVEGEILAGHTDQVRAVACVTSTHGYILLASGGHDGVVRLWSPATRKPVHDIPLGSPIHALLPNSANNLSHERTNGGASLNIGMRSGILTLELDNSLFGAG
jgi:WD40 repeat protein